MKKAVGGQRLKANIEKFEGQHKKISELTDKAIELMEKTDSESIYEALAIITNNFNTVFIEEEKILRQYDYPEYTEHKQSHKLFIKQMLFFRRGSEEVIENIAYNVARYLTSWKKSHVLQYDKEYFSFIRVQMFLKAQKS
jgi:hemerythrin